MRYLYNLLYFLIILDVHSFSSYAPDIHKSGINCLSADIIILLKLLIATYSLPCKWNGIGYRDMMPY